MRSLLLAILLASALAGCTGSSPGDAADEAGTGAPDAPAPPANVPAAATREETAYSFSDTVTGASPANPASPGAAAEPLPVALQETFELGEGLLDLAITAGTTGGSGTARVEVTGPDGSLVFSSNTWNHVGAPNVGGAGLDTLTAQEARPAGPGTYTVAYYVAGVFGISVMVEAEYAVPTGAVVASSMAA